MSTDSKIVVDWENGEYYCEFGFCTPDGCRGHDSGWPHMLGIEIPGAFSFEGEIEWNHDNKSLTKEEASALVGRIGDTQAARLAAIREVKEWWVAALERTRTPSTWVPGQTVVDYEQAALGLAAKLDEMSKEE